MVLLVYACRQENFLNEKEANNKVNSNIRILKLSQIPKVEKYLKKQIGREDFQIPMEKHGKTSKLGLDLASISTDVVVEKVLGDRVYYVLGIVNTKIANEIYNVEIKQQKGVLESIRIIGYKSKRGKTKDFNKFTGTVSSYRIDGDPISSVDYTDGIGDCSPGGGGEPTYNGSEDPSPGDGGNYSSGSGNGYDGTEPISSSDCWDRVADRDEPWLTVGYYNNCTGQFISLYGVESLTPDCGDGSGVIIVDPPVTPTPCERLRNQLLDDTFNSKVDILNTNTVLNYDHEMGFAASYPPAGTGIADTQYQPMDNKVNTGKVILPDGDRFFGYIHTHNDSDGVVKIFSDADIATFLTSCVRNAETSGNREDAYCMVITSEGSYMLKYTGDGSHSIGPNQLTKWKNKYLEMFQKIVGRDELNQSNVEKFFAQFLKDVVKINGLELYKVDGTTATKLQADINNNLIKTTCP